jgi:DNA-binding MltR family transcriptional regulator
LNNPDFRSAVITSVALLDVGLERLLRARMRLKFNSDDESRLFGSAGLLGGFSAKIRIAYAFKIIGPDTRHDLSNLNDVRNVLAHSPHAITLANKVLWGKVEGLRVSPKLRKQFGAKYPRQAFLLAAITGYSAMLCFDRHKRVTFPPTRGTVFGLAGGNTLRF